MASQSTANPKSSSRWGSFLANVESRLDTILADEDTPKGAGNNGVKVQDQPPAKKETMTLPAGGASTPPRPSSTTRAQDRLNERLARAMANKNIAKKADGSVPVSGTPSRTASPANGLDSPRESAGTGNEDKSGPEDDSGTKVDSPALRPVNGVESESKTEEAASESNSKTLEVSAPEIEPSASSPALPVEEESLATQHTSTNSPVSGSARPSAEIERPGPSLGTAAPHVNGVEPTVQVRSSGEYEATIVQLKSDVESTELRRQEETHDYMERIDALQAKLQYLTREALEAAKNAAAEATPNSPEQRIAARDERITLLIEEGQKLSQTELKHMNVIKKLRAKSGEDDKAVQDSKRSLERQQRVAKEALERARRAESAEKQASEKAKSYSRLERELESAKAEKDANDQLVQDLQLELSEATSAAREAEEKARAEALEQERKQTANLADELSNLRIEKELGDKAHQNELREIRGKSERDKERARVAEIERQAEQDTLESRLESYRARAEDAATGQGGDIQAKLLRQIETLQNQYAVASENWQGIEGSLLTRVTVLERERDDIAKRESDIRRKARESNTKCRRMEEDLERATARLGDLDSESSAWTSQISSLQERLANAEKEIIMSRNNFKAEREAWDAHLATRIEEEKVKFREELRNTPDALDQQFRTDSPIRRTRKSSNADRFSSTQGRRSSVQPAQGLGISTNANSPYERSVSRQSSDKRVFSASSELASQIPYPLHTTPHRTDSMNAVPQLSINNGIPETPSIHDSKAGDDYFDDLTTPATPDRTIDDVMSVSTAAAGPSVQLVERMSAAVRRLESEKAAHKDELSRLLNQRDEAREQVVELMKDNDGKKASDDRVRKLEKEMTEIKERYLTTLEMLGEKSERVEELKADVDDLKGLYRELVERTTR